MKKFHLVIIVICLFLTSNAQNSNLLWVEQAGESYFDAGNSIASDSDGNVYTISHLGGLLDSSIPEAIVIQKRNSNGTALWEGNLEGNYYGGGYSITVDTDDNVYTVGNFIGTMDFNPDIDEENLTSAGGTDIFVHKLDTDGNFLWVKQLSGNNSCTGVSISTDAEGNVYTTGFFSGTVDFNPGIDEENLTSIGGTDIFVHKLDSNGNFVWVNQTGGSGYNIANSLSNDASGNLYVTGGFSGTVDFNE